MLSTLRFVIGFLAMIIAFLFFNGLLGKKGYINKLFPVKYHSIISAFDFNTLNGNYGKLLYEIKPQYYSLRVSHNKPQQQVVTQLESSSISFRGINGKGIKDGFLFALSIIPALMFALAMLNVFEYLGAFNVANYLFDIPMQIIFGLPGCSLFSMVTSLSNSDVGAAMTRNLKENHEINDQECNVLAMFQFTSGATIVSTLIYSSLIFVVADAGKYISISLVIAILLLVKLINANMIRLFNKLLN